MDHTTRAQLLALLDAEQLEDGAGLEIAPERYAEIAAGASLGNLIPPGIALIVYGAMTNTSVGQLYAAAVIPGVVMTVLFMATIVLMAWLKPDWVRQQEAVDRLGIRLRRLVDLQRWALQRK